MSLYELVGGSDGVRALVDRFYDLMDALPEAYEVRSQHPDDLTESRQKLFEFLSGWLGGPGLYVAKHGHPRLRARHMPFAISARERDQWLLCMRRAVNELVEHPQTRAHLVDAFGRVADHMRNR